MTWRIAALAGGIAALWIAVASPLAHLDHHLLTAHMVQHLLLMLVAAPLILLGADSILVRRRLNLAVCWLVGALTVVVWHVPAVFEIAMRSQFWHVFEHTSFLIAGIVFWWPVIDASPKSPWSTPLYLFLATLPCDALSAFLVFCGHVVYRHYGSGHGAAYGLSPAEDQGLAGALMWVTVTFAYLIPALLQTARTLSSERMRLARAGVS